MLTNNNKVYIKYKFIKFILLYMLTNINNIYIYNIKFIKFILLYMLSNLIVST